ncbi:MAG: hypothetical protein AAFR46_02725 [Pseudomonadota bacterium]
MPAPRTKYPDRVLLEALARLQRGVSARQVAAWVSLQIGETITRNALLGVVRRINEETDASDQGQIGNGSMPFRWWAGGR